MKILVAGGAGYIGSCTVEYLLDHGHEVTVFDSLVKGHREAVDPRVARFIPGDLADRAAILRAMQETKPEGIIHFAAFIEVGESMKDPGKYFGNNDACGLNLLDAAVACGVDGLFFECHPDPAHARSDAATQLPLDQAAAFLDAAARVRAAVGE